VSYYVNTDGCEPVRFDCFHAALKRGRTLGNNHVTDRDGMVLAVHGDTLCDDAGRSDTSALRRAQCRNDKRTGHTLRAPENPFQHAVHDASGCRHDWQRFAHDALSFRCATCNALGYRTHKPSRYAEDRPVLARRCSSRGCRDVARHAGYNGHMRGLCDLHGGAEVAA
jgi:hypothetical protein